MTLSPTLGFYPYYEAFPHSWEKDFEQFSLKNRDKIILPIPWGIHEPIRGHCDFQKSARLRIEKLLGFAQQRKLSVEILLTLSGKKGSLPDWVIQSGKRNQIPAGLWEGFATGYLQKEIPAISLPLVEEGFLEFCHQLLSILTLYLAPDGPVSGVGFDLTEYYFSCAKPSESEIVGWWSKRFSTIQEFNRVFGTAFSNFSATGNTRAIRQLLDKRSWLCAYEFRKYLDDKVSQFGSKIQSLANRHQVRVIESSQLNNGTIYIDDIAYLEKGKNAYPLLSWGQWNETQAMSFGFVERLLYNLNFLEQAPMGIQGVKYFPLQTILFCGRNLPLSVCEKILDRIESGGEIFFPFGLPSYDEKMNELPWLTKGKQEQISFSETKLISRNIEGGNLLYPIEPFPLEKFHMENFPSILSQFQNYFKRTSV